jgi:hypothetical protein
MQFARPRVPALNQSTCNVVADLAPHRTPRDDGRRQYLEFVPALEAAMCGYNASQQRVHALPLELIVNVEPGSVALKTAQGEFCLHRSVRERPRCCAGRLHRYSRPIRSKGPSVCITSDLLRRHGLGIGAERFVLGHRRGHGASLVHDARTCEVARARIWTHSDGWRDMAVAGSPSNLTRRS